MPHAPDMGFGVIIVYLGSADLLGDKVRSTGQYDKSFAAKYSCSLFKVGTCFMSCQKRPPKINKCGSKNMNNYMKSYEGS